MLIENINFETTTNCIKQCFYTVLITFCHLILTCAQQPTPTANPTNRERVAVPSESAKPKEQSADEDEVIKVNSKLVIVPVSVIDANGQAVKNLTTKDFRLEEEGKSQEISEVSTAEQVPLEIALLIDVSSSTNQLFEYEKAAAARFLQSVMKSDDKASIFLISDKAVFIQSREPAEKTAETLRTVNLNQAQTQTAFFDTVSAAVEYLKKNAPERSRRVILSLSDGADNWSSSTRTAEMNAWRSVDVNTLTEKKRNEVAQQTDTAQRKTQDKILRDLQNGDIVFYSVNPAGSSIKLNKIILRGQQGLQKFSDETGGTAFMPQILQNNPREPLQGAENFKRNEQTLEKIFQQIAAELRAQYLLQFYSEANFPSGKYVRLKTSVNDNNSLRVKARQGYFATAQ